MLADFGRFRDIRRRHAASGFSPRKQRPCHEQKTAQIRAESRAVLDTLRRAGEPLSVPEIAKRIIVERGLDQGDRALYRNMSKRVSMALRYQRTNGMVDEVSSNDGMAVWNIEK